MISKFFIILIFALTYFSLWCEDSYARNKSPEEVITQYDTAYLNNNWRKIAELTSPDLLSFFKKNLNKDYFKIAEPDIKSKKLDSLINLSNIELYAFFLKYLYSKIPDLTDENKKLIIGTVYENKKYSYVVYKTSDGFVNVIKLKNYNNEWKIDFLDPFIELTFMEFTKP